MAEQAFGGYSAVPLPRVDLPVAVVVQQLQIVEPVLTSVTTPTPMMNVPGLFLHLQRLPARHALASLSLP